MGQVNVNCGKNDEAGKAGENLFAMHLQWCLELSRAKPKAVPS